MKYLPRHRLAHFLNPPQDAVLRLVWADEELAFCDAVVKYEGMGVKVGKLADRAFRVKMNAKAAMEKREY